MRAAHVCTHTLNQGVWQGMSWQSVRVCERKPRLSKQKAAPVRLREELAVHMW
jgi:hypothetical protein